MPCSPCGTFVGYTQAQLDIIKAAALARVNGGSRTSLSGGVKSGSKEWTDAMNILNEVRFAEQQNGTLPARVQKVVQVLTVWPPEELQ